MVDQMTLQTIGILLTGLTLSIAAIYYTLTLRYTRRNQELTLRAQEQAVETRQAQLFMEMYRDFKRSDIQKAYNDIVYVWKWDGVEDFDLKYGRRNNYDEFHKYMLVYSVYEGLGVLVYRKLIDVTMIEELMRSYVVSFWEKMAPIIYDWRVQWPLAAEWMEYLYNEVSKIESKPAYLRT